MMSYVAPDTLQDQLENGIGYYLGLSFSENELQVLRTLVENHWLENIKQVTPMHIDKFSERGMERYHELSHLLDHTSLWTKKNRILPQVSVDFIRSSSLIKKLENIYGDFKISDEENVGREEIYWRLVRPHKPTDMGPIHADAWFWELGHGVTPRNVKRVKVWIALFCEPGLNGLCLVPESQKQAWKYHGESRHGFVKPQIDEDITKLSLELVYTKPGNSIVFNDKLLHGGALNKGTKTRVSMEFTMFVKNN